LAQNQEIGSINFLAKNQAKLDLDPLFSTQFLRQEFNSLNFSTRFSRFQVQL